MTLLTSERSDAAKQPIRCTTNLAVGRKANLKSMLYKEKLTMVEFDIYNLDGVNEPE